MNPESLVTVLISMLYFDNTCFQFCLPLWSKLNQIYIKHIFSSFKFTFQNILIILPLFSVTMLFFSINYVFMFFVLSFLPLMCYYFYLNVGAGTKELPNWHVTATWNDYHFNFYHFSRLVSRLLGSWWNLNKSIYPGKCDMEKLGK